MINTRVENRKIIPQLSDKTEYIYIEKARIEQDDASICILRSNEHISVPVCQIACIILGPGTTITHRAVSSIADSGCTLVWAGEDLGSYYATGFEKDRSSRNILRQIEHYSDNKKHLDVCRKMYRLRFADIPINGLDELSLEQMRGMEGLRIKEIYEKYAHEYNVEWNGRQYRPSDIDGQDTVNYLLTIGNQWLYHICRAAIYTLGYSPAVGFIHTGKMDSFVYDIADLYKTEIVIPSAFSLVNKFSYKSQYHCRRAIREKCLRKSREIHLFKRIVRDIEFLFSQISSNDKDGHGFLWDETTLIEQGVNYSDFLS